MLQSSENDFSYWIGTVFSLILQSAARTFTTICFIFPSSPFFSSILIYFLLKLSYVAILIKETLHSLLSIIHLKYVLVYAKTSRLGVETRCFLCQKGVNFIGKELVFAGVVGHVLAQLVHEFSQAFGVLFFSPVRTNVNRPSVHFFIPKDQSIRYLLGL